MAVHFKKCETKEEIEAKCHTHQGKHQNAGRSIFMVIIIGKQQNHKVKEKGAEICDAVHNVGNLLGIRHEQHSNECENEGSAIHDGYAMPGFGERCDNQHEANYLRDEECKVKIAGMEGETEIRYVIVAHKLGNETYGEKAATE